MNELDDIRESLAKIMREDSIDAWLSRPNDALHGETPIEVIEKGDADRLREIIHVVGSGEPM